MPLSRIIDEYCILRRVVLTFCDEDGSGYAALGDEGMRQRVRDLARLNLAVDGAIAQTIRRYVNARDRHVATVEQRLRLTLEAAAIGTWDLDVRSGVFTWDSRCREIFGLPDESQGAYQRFVAAVHPDDRVRVADAARASLTRKNGGEYRAEYRIIRPDDRAVRWVSSRGSAFFDEQGHAVRFIGIVIDVTDAKSAEQVRERFIGILGHDLRSPLGTISLAANHMLCSGKLPSEMERSAATIARAADRMNRMIRDLLDLARGRLGGGLAVAPAPTDLGEVCRSLVEEMEVLHPTRSIALVTDGDLTGRWDADRLAQAVSNLVVNAVVHGGDPIVVTARGDSGVVTVAVSNGGPVIPEHERPHLFDPFRAGRGKGSLGGLGLGLYIVSEVVAAHRGAVEVQSDHSGTTFTLRLPRGT